MRKLFSTALVIARRDFISIVGTPTFLIFLFTPLLMLLISGGSGVGAASLAASSENKSQLVALARGTDAERLRAADTQMRGFLEQRQPSPLAIVTPQADISAQIRALLKDEQMASDAILSGPLDRPTITFPADNGFSSRYLAALSELAARSAREGRVSGAPVSKAEMVSIKAPVVNVSTRQAAGVAAVFIIFLLTLLLAGQTVSMLAEEKSNKVIEILAASVRLEAVFFGKLLGMFGVAAVFVAFWGSIIGIGALLLPDDLTLAGKMVDFSGYRPAIGLPLFLVLGGAYFTMAFMLLGAVFLGIGAQASTMREIQMMSLPITILQVGMFGLSSAAAGNPGSTVARIAEWFPFSSPFAMAAHGATDPAIWPHLVALVWQGLWVSITIWFSARLFRKGVLKSGSWRSVFGLSEPARAV
jgi:ABC-2 type transport system permease protein